MADVHLASRRPLMPFGIDCVDPLRVGGLEADFSSDPTMTGNLRKEKPRSGSFALDDVSGITPPGLLQEVEAAGTRAGRRHAPMCSAVLSQPTGGRGLPRTSPAMKSLRQRAC